MNKSLENVLYVRSATGSEQSLQLQKTYGQKYAKLHSLHLNIIEDSHVSGHTQIDKRTGSRLLLHLVEVGLTKKVIIDVPHRISRNFVELLYLYSFLEKHKAELIILEGGEKFEE